MPGAPSKAKLKAVNMNPKYKPEEIWDARKMNHLLKKTAGNKGSHPKREATWAVPGNATGEELPKLLGVHVSPKSVPNTGCRTTRSNVLPCWFLVLLWFDSFLLSPFWNGNVYSLPLYVRSITFFYIFTGSIAKCLSLRGDSGL